MTRPFALHESAVGIFRSAETPQLCLLLGVIRTLSQHQLAAMIGRAFCSATGAKSLKALPTITLAGLIAAAALLPAARLSPAAAMDISGAGATFPYPIFLKWADAYQKET